MNHTATSPSAMPDEIVSRIRAALAQRQGPVALHEPTFLGNEKRYLEDCIDTGWVSYAGAYVSRFEQALADACSTKHAIAVTSGTVALQVALQVGGLHHDDEVLVPALTFVASANAVVHAGGIPHFVDVEEKTFGISPYALESHLEKIAEPRVDGTYNRATGRRIAALMPVHIFGHPVDMDSLIELADKYRFFVVEDATEALGSRYKGRPCGSLARLATLSFNGNKVVTTGGGGAILTDDTELAQRIRHLTTTAKQPHRWAFIHDEVGWNYRLPNVNAALGLAQIERLDSMIEAKRRLWQRYSECFHGLAGVRIFSDAPFAESNHWLVSLILDDPDMLEPVLRITNDAGLMTRPAWAPMHTLAMYLSNPRAPLPVTERLARTIVNLPSSPFLAPA